MDKELFDELHSNLKEAVKMAKGEIKLATVYFVLTPKDIKAIREGVGLSQKLFAQTFHLSLNTIQGWEQGKRSPDAAATNFLRLIKADSNQVLRMLKVA